MGLWRILEVLDGGFSLSLWVKMVIFIWKTCVSNLFRQDLVWMDSELSCCQRSWFGFLSILKVPAFGFNSQPKFGYGKGPLRSLCSIYWLSRLSLKLQILYIYPQSPWFRHWRILKVPDWDFDKPCYQVLRSLTCKVK